MNIMMEEIVVDEAGLRRPCEPATSYRQAKQISEKLFDILARSENGIGLAANQVGISKRVCVVALPGLKRRWFMNPTFEGSGELVEFEEGCLSFPGESVRTLRYPEIVVKADNLKRPLRFVAECNTSLLECVCVQHEICHLYGETMHDYAAPPPVEDAMAPIDEAIKDIEAEYEEEIELYRTYGGD